MHRTDASNRERKCYHVAGLHDKLHSAYLIHIPSQFGATNDFPATRFILEMNYISTIQAGLAYFYE